MYYGTPISGAIFIKWDSARVFINNININLLNIYINIYIYIIFINNLLYIYYIFIPRRLNSRLSCFPNLCKSLVFLLVFPSGSMYNIFIKEGVLYFGRY